MITEYSLLILKQELSNLEDKKRSIETDDGRWHLINPQRELTKLIHQISDIKFSIEVLETYQD